MTFKEAINFYPHIITEGSIIERLKREFKYPLDEILSNALMIYDESGKVLLEKLYREYIDIALSANFPIMLLTPTWRANKERTSKANIDMNTINTDAFIFVDKIRKSYENFSDKIYIGGLTGCKGDAYKPEEALSESDAYEFHKEQMQILADAGVDFLLASTLPEINEAKGIAKAMSDTKKDYVISFVIRDNGKLLDGSLLTDAIRIIDDSVSSPPLFYLTNCIHPDVLHKSFLNLNDENDILKKRLYGIQANASSKSPEELDTLEELDADSTANWASGMADLNKKYNLKILGGCCGTDARFISSMIDHLK
ncbi:MAG: homocysteine S-methyltransferase family protein [Ignavibacteriales bacterium]|nr:homocysteine S-methyltransferase family protein [Ignavibacteriales bacterium]